MPVAATLDCFPSLQHSSHTLSAKLLAIHSAPLWLITLGSNVAAATAWQRVLSRIARIGGSCVCPLSRCGSIAYRMGQFDQLEVSITE